MVVLHALVALLQRPVIGPDLAPHATTTPDVEGVSSWNPAPPQDRSSGHWNDIN